MQECNQLNEMGLRHGYWEEYHLNGRLWYKGYYKNGHLDGYWERYDHKSKLISKGHYINNERKAYWLLFGKEYYYATM